MTIEDRINELKHIILSNYGDIEEVNDLLDEAEKKLREIEDALYELREELDRVEELVDEAISMKEKEESE